jgi:enamine deaminase RidA (YjgF/YER057c/UK114 family)
MRKGNAVDIQRWPARGPGRSRAVQWHGLIWAVASTADISLGIDGQINDCLQRLERTLTEAGSDKTRLLSVQVFLADMAFKPKLDEAWNAWIGPHPNDWPQRACLGVALAPGLLVEIVAMAAVRDAHDPS